MSPQSNSTRQRIIQAALDLFVAQGVSNTTTRQIADRAEVNEVTLFRRFGNKYGLLLAVIEESPSFTNLGEALIQQLSSSGSADQALKEYVTTCLYVLEHVPEFVRSLIGESDHYPAANRQALGQRLLKANRSSAQYLAAVLQRGHLTPQQPPETIAGLLNATLLGYAVIEFTSESHGLWHDRDDFLDQVVRLFLYGAASAGPGAASAGPVADLPAHLVHQIMLQARRSSVQDAAIAYVLFGAGLTAAEVVRLQRAQRSSDLQHQTLQIAGPNGMRQVPVNQWIWGKRFGTYSSNPLSKWLKSRKDPDPEMFVTEQGPLSAAELDQRWQTWVQALVTPTGQPPTIDQAHPTWCLEMVMRGMSLEHLSLLTGRAVAELQAYADRAREKAALEQAALLDQKSPPRR